MGPIGQMVLLVLFPIGSLMIRAKPIWLTGVLFLMVFAPLILETRYSQHVMILVLLYVALGSAWNILGGFAGQLSLGHAAFFGIGAYTAAVIASKTTLSPWWAIIAG